MTHLSLCSGILGLDLAAHWAGFSTVATCERDPDCQKVIRRLLPGVPIFDDVKDVTTESIRQRGIGNINLISAGFPCQPFSVAGSRKGDGDDRHLWPEIARILRDVRPRFFVGENVRGLLSISSGRVFGSILRDLADMGMRVGWGCYGADEAAGHSHRRDRTFIFGYLADGSSVGCEGLSRCQPESGHDFGATEGAGRGMREFGGTCVGLGDTTGGQDLKRRPGSMGQTEGGGRCFDNAADASIAELGDSQRLRRSGDSRRRTGAVTRDRCSELAHTPRDGRTGEGTSGRQDGVSRDASGELADSEGLGRETGRSVTFGAFEGFARPENGGFDFPPGPRDFGAWRELLIRKPYLAPALTPKAAVELGIRPRTDGISRRMALRMLGNAVDPWQAYPLFKAIAEVAA